MTMEEIKWHHAIVYQITQECPFKCDICLRFYTPGENILSPEDRLRMVDILKQHDVKSISVTGGEPLILKDQLVGFLKYLHQQKIHTALTSTGFGLTKDQVMGLNQYLDRMVISIRSLDPESWEQDFGETEHSPQLFETVLGLLQWIKSTDIVLEVTTVLHKENLTRIAVLGRQLAEITPNAVWRIDEYYPIGKQAHNRKRFQLDDGEFDQVAGEIAREFAGVFRDVRLSSWAERQRSPGLMITQAGEIMDSAGQSTGCNIMKNQFPVEFKMSKPWSDYRKVCRDWGWGDL